ncbi:MAG: glucosaminidase domain-containing protein [Muribaculum sp.]|nr:glucosaminidase domain-containing protein [Ruminococcus flavefaciens]MCM1373623.1 glucosaminidase domain-containing protein [Muribaculum sp.]
MMGIKICIDAGHYGKYNRSPAIPEYYESDMVWKLHLLQKQYLEEYEGVTVITTRQNQATDKALYDRGACSKGCDLFISDHSNAVGSGVNDSVDYVAIYHLTDDTTTQADDISKVIAGKLAPVIADVMGASQGGRIVTRKSGNDRNGDGMLNDNYYGVLHGARMVNTPGMILEHSFHTNTKMTRWLLDDSNLARLARAEVEVLAAHFGLKKKGAAASADTTGTQAIALKDLSEKDMLAKVGALFTADQQRSGILASVSLAQFILESGWGKSELAQNANNCFGMKCSLSGNTWGGSAWDGSSKYTKATKEQGEDGSYETITADFRKYPDIEHSIADHSAYLNGAMKGSKKRYEGLAGEKDYKRAVQLIKDGGYATSLTYVDNLCSIIEKWNLTQYDATGAASSGQAASSMNFPDVPFTVQVIVDDLNFRSSPEMGNNVKGQTGKGVFTIVEVRNGWGRLKSDAGWIYLENPEYCTIQGTAQETAAPATFVPYTVRVKVADLNIRKDATIDARSVGYTGKGIFTIVEEKKGKVAKDGTVGLWGRLKSDAGWVCLAFDAYTERV